MKTIVRQLSFYKSTAEIFECYKERDMAAFLDSSLENELGRYSFIGLFPYLVLREEGGIVYKNGERIQSNIETEISRYLELNFEESTLDIPLISGAIGYFSYDYGRKFEQIVSHHRKETGIPEAVFAFYDLIIIDDKKEEKIYLTARGETEEPSVLLDKIEMEIKNSKKVDIPEKWNELAEFKSDFEKEDYKKAIEKMISYIKEGDIYIANMTQHLEIRSEKKPYDVYRYLRYHNPSPFGGYLNYGSFQIICASPERFLKVSDRWIETRPVKGTRKRGETPEEDRFLKEELRNSSKDRSELLMIVDLERNDLSRVCEGQTVKVLRHFDVETYATVFHLVTTIVGKMRKNFSFSDLIQATFPGGSITGAPKIRAMEIIDELEHSSRGIYTGSLGYLSLNGSCDFNIIIRTAVCQNGSYYLGVGGGITCESDPEFEYEETIQKAKAVLEAIGEGEKIC